MFCQGFSVIVSLKQFYVIFQAWCRWRGWEGSGRVFRPPSLHLFAKQQNVFSMLLSSSLSSFEQPRRRTWEKIDKNKEKKNWWLFSCKIVDFFLREMFLFTSLYHGVVLLLRKNKYKDTCTRYDWRNKHPSQFVYPDIWNQE